jgi:hypothetical protein
MRDMVAEPSWPLPEPDLTYPQRRSSNAKVSGGEFRPSQRELSRYIKYIARTWLAHAFPSSNPPTPATQYGLSPAKSD